MGQVIWSPVFCVDVNSGPMETEIKLPMPDGAADALARIEREGYVLRAARVLQSDQVVDNSGGDLARAGQLLRVRSENGRAILTYKGPLLPGRHKSREEREVSTSDSAALLAILQRLGYVVAFRYEKYRTTFGRPEEAGLLALDETPIGVFLELEGPEEWIDRTALRLGFTPRDYVLASYAALYREYLVTHRGPADMVFEKQPEKQP